ncbi:MAG: hypothetical protein IT381_23470 [Deltaproteobacteria bacterium]|nr:hypothetical protein [Deltaproteobacteria bacterium]
MTKSNRARSDAIRPALVALVMGAACILPPPVAVEEQINNEPFVVNETAKPQKAFVELNLNCETCTFSLQIEDPDITDTLFYRWFFDYDTLPASDGFCSNKVQPPANPNADRTLVTCDVPLNSRFQDAKDDGSIHTLETWIADREFLPEGLPTGRALPDDAHVAVKQWTVRIRRRGIGCDDLEQLSCKSKVAR